MVVDRVGRHVMIAGRRGRHREHELQIAAAAHAARVSMDDRRCHGFPAGGRATCRSLSGETRRASDS